MSIIAVGCAPRPPCGSLLTPRTAARKVGGRPVKNNTVFSAFPEPSDSSNICRRSRSITTSRHSRRPGLGAPRTTTTLSAMASPRPSERYGAPTADPSTSDLSSSSASQVSPPFGAKADSSPESTSAATALLAAARVFLGIRPKSRTRSRPHVRGVSLPAIPQG